MCVLQVGVSPGVVKAEEHSLFFKGWERKKRKQIRSYSRTLSLRVNCPVTKRVTATVENGLTFASVPVIQCYFCAGLVLVSL